MTAPVFLAGGSIVGDDGRFHRRDVLVADGRVTEVGATDATLPREWKDWFTRTAMPPMRVGVNGPSPPAPSIASIILPLR